MCDTWLIRWGDQFVRHTFPGPVNPVSDDSVKVGEQFLAKCSTAHNFGRIRMNFPYCLSLLLVQSRKICFCLPHLRSWLLIWELLCSHGSEWSLGNYSLDILHAIKILNALLSQVGFGCFQEKQLILENFRFFLCISTTVGKKTKRPQNNNRKKKLKSQKIQTELILSRCSKDKSVGVCFASVLFATFPGMGRIPVPQALSALSSEVPWGQNNSPQVVVGSISSLKLFKIQECVNSSISKLQEYWLCKQRTYFFPFFNK